MNASPTPAHADCTMCEHRCHVDRTAGPAGRCRAGAHPRVFSRVLSCAEEMELVPALAISLSGCNLLCHFCITGEESQDASAGAPARLDALVDQALRAVADEGAASVLVLGGEPTIHAPFLLELAGALRDAGVGVPLALKTNLLSTPTVLDDLCGTFDTIVADLKFGTDRCGARLAGFSGGYVRVLTDNLHRVAASGTRLLVRHLAMPGHVECCAAGAVRIVDGLRRSLPDAGVEFAIRDHYVPAFRARRIAGLARSTSAGERAALARLRAEVPA